MSVEFYDVTTNKYIELDRHNHLHGRRVIYTSETDINETNIIQVLNDALVVHSKNAAEIDYLHRYVRGMQPIMDRKKTVREEICNKIVVNLASSTVAFKSANFIGDPLQYVSRGTSEKVPQEIEKLNSFMLSEGKASEDMRLAHWMFTCGVGYRLVLRDKAESYMKEELFDEAPFELYTLDPRQSFVIRSSDVSHKVLAGVTYVKLKGGVINYTVYTRNQRFVIEGGVSGSTGTYTFGVGEVKDVTTHNSGIVPIVEYACNSLRMGAFEVALDVLDAINNIQSNRLDGVEQFIQAIMVFENVDIDSEDFSSLKEEGALKISSKDGNVAKVYYLNEQLDQSQTQTLIDDLKQLYYEIVGMPSQGDGNTGDSSNNGAVYMKNGLYSANARALETDSEFRRSETEMLRIILRICSEVGALDLKLSEIDMKFGLRSYEDMITKTQSFSTLMSAGCSPLQSAKISALTPDPESFAIEYEAYNEKKQAKVQEQEAAQVQDNAQAANDTEEIVVDNEQ